MALAPAPIPGIPHAKQWPVVGSLVPFATGPIPWLRAQRDQHGELVQMTLVNHRLLLINDPALIDQALVGSWKSLHKDVIYEFIRPLLGNGLITAEGSEWKRNRRIVAPFFTPRHIENYRQTMQRCTDAWVESVRGRGVVDIFEEMMNLTQDIVLQTLFGGDLTSDTSRTGEIIGTFLEEFAIDAQGRRAVLPKWVPTPGRRRSARVAVEADELMRDIIQERRAKGLADDLLSRLLAARDADGNALSDQEIRDEALTLYAAGHETTGTALTYTLMLLGAHPDEQAKLAADPTRARAVLQESMRMLPPVWAIGRETQEPIQIGSHTIPAHIQLLICMSVMHSDPRWFPKPDQFRPDRWLVDQELPRHAYMPFGAGPRICVGNHFAMMEAEINLKTIINAFEVELMGPFPPKTLASVTLRPQGDLRMRLRPRYRGEQSG